MTRPIVGIMGPGEDATDKDREVARRIGALIARQGWVLLTGGRKAGVMDAASEGARAAGGLVLGILPGNDKTDASIHLDLAILTNLGEARNVLNVLTSDIVVGIGMNPGTASEIAHAIKANKDIILLNCPPAGKEFFSVLGKGRVRIADTVEEAECRLIECMKAHGIFMER